MKKVQKILCTVACVAMLGACQNVKQGLSSAQEQVQGSSLQFRRLMASLNMQKYVPGMPDMPVYHSFEPLGDENAVYDVVEGRIIDITYASTIAEVDKVKDFYDIALEQLGWQPTKKLHHYVRDDETLLLKVTSDDQKVTLHILLQPSDK